MRLGGKLLPGARGVWMPLDLFRPPGTVVPGGLVLLLFLFFQREIELPRPIAVKLCHVIESRFYFTRDNI